MTADWPIGFNNIFQPSTQAINEIAIIITIVTEVASSKMNRYRRPDFESCKLYYILIYQYIEIYNFIKFRKEINVV